MKTNKTVNKILKIVLLISLVVGTGFTCLYPIPEYADNMWLQHIGTLLLLIPLLYDSITNRMPLSAFICLSCFTVLHIVGARYIYSYVPYKDWLSAIGGNPDLFASVMDFGAKSDHSNQYDRLVHLSFGVLMFPFLLHFTRKWVGQRPLVAILFAWLFIQTFSMIYEVFEWQLSAWCEGGDAYNGQQGDIWDAQKDMALAMIGSTIMAVFYSCKKNRV